MGPPLHTRNTEIVRAGIKKQSERQKALPKKHAKFQHSSKILEIYRRAFPCTTYFFGRKTCTVFGSWLCEIWEFIFLPLDAPSLIHSIQHLLAAQLVAANLIITAYKIKKKKSFYSIHNGIKF